MKCDACHQSIPYKQGEQSEGVELRNYNRGIMTLVRFCKACSVNRNFAYAIRRAEEGKPPHTTPVICSKLDYCTRNENHDGHCAKLRY